ncbi:flavin-containing monooxygenase [Rhodococcus qingshengii]|jgi:cation diffusion facilitator CzcD-associated flavoprotein CzcO|uniref:flavin-containing monooxygenase n=1 Tax=Rhodococcus qingshengii TaxID=334542 RepID=UPI0035E224BC
MNESIDRPAVETFDQEPVALDRETLARNLQDADPAILLLCAAHATGDLTLLDRYASSISRRPGEGRNALPVVTMEAGARTSVTDLLLGALGAAPIVPELLVGDLDVFARMVEIAVGEKVSPEFLPLLLEQSGFVPSQSVVPRTKSPKPGMRIAVLGAGMAGIAAGIMAERFGYEYEIFEQSNDIGGTWRMNTYPGVAVDTPSLYYSYSFDLNADWTRYYPVGNEYQQYLRRVVESHGIKEHITFDTEVTGLRWIEQDSEWELSIRAADSTMQTSRATTVITAFGFLNRPKFPEISGIEDFAGISMHTAQWKDADLRGKRVAVIGAGATAVQVVGEIADSVSDLTLFQRQPHWVMPSAPGSGVVPDTERWLLARLPFYNQWFRLKTYWGLSDNLYDNIRADPEWAENNVSISPANDRVMQTGLAYLQSMFADRPDLLAELTPDYAPAGKRLIRDPGNFYASLKLPHVSLTSERIEKVVSSGVVTADGRTHEVDVIIYATGFTLDFLSPMDIVGREGRVLNDEWQGDDPVAYLGGTVPGFPNLFVTSAPNTSPGHGGGHNFPTESVLHYIFECLQILVENGGTSIEVSAEATEEYNARVAAQLENTVWTIATGAHTYYRNRAGRVILPSPWRMVDFWTMLREPDLSAFTIR